MTVPVDDPIVAMAIVLLVHVPPATPSLKVLGTPIHAVLLPKIAVGDKFTVTIVLTKQVPTA